LYERFLENHFMINDMAKKIKMWQEGGAGLSKVCKGEVSRKSTRDYLFIRA
jgi:hypothetical protein